MEEDCDLKSDSVEQLLTGNVSVHSMHTATQGHNYYIAMQSEYHICTLPSLYRDYICDNVLRVESRRNEKFLR